jgi:hypothetical protein
MDLLLLVVVVEQAERRKTMARSRRMAPEFYPRWSTVDRWFRIEPATSGWMGLFLNHYMSGKKAKYLTGNELRHACLMAERLR